MIWIDFRTNDETGGRIYQQKAMRVVFFVNYVNLTETMA